MYNSKKAQISDTMSWIVATVIIVLILSIPILLVEIGIFGKKSFYLNRLQDSNDLIATKSISGYLLKNYDAILKKGLENKKLSLGTEPPLDSFLSTLSRDKNIETWNLIVEVDEKRIYPETLLSFPSIFFHTYFYFNEDNKMVTFKFFMGQKILRK
jgi:hypothetical protein